MNEQEKRFKESIKNKISKYYIEIKKGQPLTFNECLRHAQNKFIENHYQDGSPAEIVDIGIEKFLCEKSPLYFISKYCTFTLPGVGTISADKLYYYQKEILKKFPYYKKIVLTKSRQTGLSTLSGLLMFWKMIFQKKQWGVIISKDGKSATDLLEKVKENLDHIPIWSGVKVTANNIKGLKFSNGSKIDSFARSKSAGRGTSPTFCILDEAAFYQTANIIEGIVSSVVPSLARTSGTLMVISTPNGTTGEGAWYYDQVMKLKEVGGEDGNSILFPVDWWECPDIEGMPPYKGFNKQLGEFIEEDYFNNQNVRNKARAFFAPIAEKPNENEWLKAQYKTSGEVKYRQEILQDFIVMGSSVFSAKILEKVEKRMRAPIDDGNLGDRYYKGFWTWKYPELNRDYIIGIDVAKGSGDDSSVIEVVDIESREQVAEYLGRCSTYDLAHLASKIARFYNDAYIYVECNSIGEAVFNELYYNIHYENMYTMKKINKHDRTEVKTGWMTTTQTRELITDCFIDHYFEEDYWNEYFPYSSRLLDQMRTWVYKGGRPDHNTGAHDDAILAMSILLYNLPKVKRKVKQGDMPSIVDDNATGGFGYDRYPADKPKYYDEHEVRDRNGYIEAEDKMRAMTGAPENYDQDPLDMYRWLIS